MLLGILLRKYRLIAKDLHLLNTELEEKITKRKSELCSALEQKKDALFLQASLDGPPSNIAILDKCGKMILVTKSWLVLFFAFPLEKVSDMGLLQLFHADQKGRNNSKYIRWK